MTKYWKLIGSVVGSVVAIALVYLATKGIGTCVPGATPDAAQVCTVAGFSGEQITGAIMLVVSAAFVHFFPANTPPSA